MPIARNNSFHLMLTDDELKLLQLLAEREGLNASDFLRTTLRRAAGTPPYMATAMRAVDLLGRLGIQPSGVQPSTHTKRAPITKKKRR